MLGPIVAIAVLAIGALWYLARPPSSSDVILVAAAGPMTGPYAAFGEQMRRGAEMAIDDVNATGGVLGRKMALAGGDDACDPKQAVAVANDLAAKGVAFVVGHFCSDASIPASAVYAEEGIIQITPASTSPALTDEAAAKGWTNVFRTCGRDDAQGAMAGRYLAARYKGRNVAIVHDETPYGRGLAVQAKKTMNAAGLKEVLYETYSSGARDFTALISRMRAARLDAVYVGGYYTDVGFMVRQAREQGVRARLVSGDSLLTEAFWGITGLAGEGTLLTFPPDPRRFESAKEVLSGFKARNFDPAGYTLYAYAAVQVWVAAAAAAGTAEGAKVAQQLRGHTYPTVIGDLTFDQKGDVRDPSYAWYVLENGKYVEMPADR